ncbi:Copia protease [Ceratocystis platani]|uniref:Copia protease n=1 Tax=Ceratocystis fimbriata f. sp. platani TaxID=88771 RepID=A0A0F8AWJ8_CERFI|nr:Copia protease [Ceratocystis platani]
MSQARNARASVRDESRDQYNTDNEAGASDVDDRLSEDGRYEDAEDEDGDDEAGLREQLGQGNDAQAAEALKAIKKDLQKVYRTRYHDTARGTITGAIEKMQKDEATLVDLVAKTHMISKVQVDAYLDQYVDTLEEKERRRLADKKARQAKKYRDDLKLARTKAKKALERMAIQHGLEHDSDSGSDEDDEVEEVPGPEGPAARPDKRHARFTTPLSEAVTPETPEANMFYCESAGSFRRRDHLRDIRQMTRKEATTWFNSNLAGMRVRLEGKKNWKDWVVQLRGALVDYKQSRVSEVSGLNDYFDSALNKLMYRTVTTDIGDKLQASHSPEEMFNMLERTYGTSATTDVMTATSELFRIRWDQSMTVDEFGIKYKSAYQAYKMNVCALPRKSVVAHLMLLVDRRSSSLTLELSDRIEGHWASQNVDDLIVSFVDWLCTCCREFNPKVDSKSGDSKGKPAGKSAGQAAGNGSGGAPRGDNNDSNIICRHCKKKGHREAKCWGRNPELRPAKTQGQAHTADGAAPAEAACVEDDDAELDADELVQTVFQQEESLVAGDMGRSVSDCGVEKVSWADGQALALKVLNHESTGHAYTVKGHSMRNEWLFDTGSTLHICNDLKWFVPGTLAPVGAKGGSITTGGGVVRFLLKGTVAVQLLRRDGTFADIRLTNVALVPQFDINIISGLDFYRKGGSIDKQGLVDRQGKHMAKLDVHERGFYLYLNGVPWPVEPTGKINIEAREVLVKMNVLQKGGDTTFVTACRVGGKSTARLLNELQLSRLLHQRLGHPHFEALKKTIEASEGSLIPVKKLVDPDDPCISCELSKAKTFKPKDRRTDLAQFPGQFVHADVTKVKEEGIGQQRWLVVMLDEYSGRIHANSFSYKGDCNRCITDQLKWYRNQTGRQLKRITVDNGTDVNIQELTAFVRSVGADIRTSPTYSPAQNGRSERTVKAMLVRMRTLMIHRNIPLALWPEIAKSVAYLHNVVVSVETGMSPLARWHVALHATPYVHDIGHLRTLGSRCVWYRNQTGGQLKRITVDNGTDVNIQELTVFVRSVGADIRTSPTYSPAQNGRSERTVKAMLVRMRTLMIHRNIPLALWPEIAKSVAYLHNVVVSVETGMSPLARWHVALHATPYLHDIGHLRTLGSRCVVRIPDAKLLQLRTSKLQAKGEEGILVGYSGHHLYRVWVKERKQVVTSNSLHIFEDLSNDDVDVMRSWPKGVWRNLQAKGEEGILVGYSGHHLYRVWVKERKQVVTSNSLHIFEDLSNDDVDVMKSWPKGVWRIH